MHLFLLHLVFSLLLNPTLQARVTYVSDSRIFATSHWASQSCSTIMGNFCCVPLDLVVPGIGRGWFRAKNVHYDLLPSLSLYLSVWREQGAARSCMGPSADDHVTNGEVSDTFTDAAEAGFGGAMYTVWVADGNGTVGGAVGTPHVVYPDTILYLGVMYTDGNRGDGVYRSQHGRFIYGHRFGDGGSLQLNAPNTSRDISGGGAMEINRAPVSVDTSK